MSASRLVLLAVAVTAWALPVAATPASTQPLPRNRLQVRDTAQVDPENDEPLDADDVRFFLTRVGFAPDPSEVAQYVGLTRAQAVDRVLANVRTEAVTPVPAWSMEPVPARAQRNAWTPDERRAEQHTRDQRYEDLRAWWVREMVTTPSPLTERMTLFWHNSFTSAQDKVAYPQSMAQQNMLLRREAMGHFGELLHDVAKDPAMLQYLDGAGSRKGRPNENFAREVMELFTLGEGHYSQQDVSEAARAYTGWSLNPDTLTYVWRANLHDDGVKTVLGERGAFDGDDVLDILLARPETATFITKKLWREFVSDTPDEASVAPIAAQFRASRYDIRVALRGLFLSEAFWDERNRGTLVKSPAEYVVGAVRSLDVAYDDTAPFAREIRTLGENLFYPPNVKGWPGGPVWINSTTLLARKQFVEQLFRATGPFGGHRVQNMTGANASEKMQTVGNRAGAAGPRFSFDIDAWLAHYNMAPSGKPELTAELQLQHAVLPLAPVDAIAAGSTGSAYLEALLMDPVYQLK